MKKFLLSLSLVALCPMIHGSKAPSSSKFADVYAAETIKDNPRDSEDALKYEVRHNQSLDAKAINGEKNHEKEVLSHEKQEKDIVKNEHQKYENHLQKLDNTTYGHGETDRYAGGETGESYEGSTGSYGGHKSPYAAHGENHPDFHDETGSPAPEGDVDPSTDLHNNHHKKSHHSSWVEKKAKKKSKADLAKKHSNHEIKDMEST